MGTTSAAEDASDEVSPPAGWGCWPDRHRDQPTGARDTRKLGDGVGGTPDVVDDEVRGDGIERAVGHRELRQGSLDHWAAQPVAGDADHACFRVARSDGAAACFRPRRQGPRAAAGVQEGSRAGVVEQTVDRSRAQLSEERSWAAARASQVFIPLSSTLSVGRR